MTTVAARAPTRRCVAALAEGHHGRQSTHQASVVPHGNLIVHVVVTIVIVTIALTQNENDRELVPEKIEISKGIKQYASNC